jgi:hypothetical protein
MKLKKLYYNFLPLVVLLMVACSDRHSENALMNIDDFTPVLADALLIEARLQSVEMPKRDSVGSLLYQTVWDIYEIDEPTFHYNLEYYTDRPEEALQLYEQVLDMLNEKEAEYIAVPQDSI